MIVPAREPEPQPRRVLNGLSDVRAFFHNNTVPLYFISPTPFNLLGIYRWIRNFFYLTYYDSFEGEHSRVFVPRRRDRRDFDGMGDVCNHLLRDPETLEFIKNRGPGGKACFVMLDEETQALARQAGLEVMHPPAELRHRLESKIVMTRLADEAGVPSVPHVIGRVSSTTNCRRSRTAQGWETTSSSRPPMATPAAQRSLCADCATGTSAPVA